MPGRFLILALVLTVCLFLSPGLQTFCFGVELRQNDNIIVPDKTSHAIVIDGSLDEPVWQRPAINRQFITYSPNQGDPLGQQTLVWAAYDTENIYFAFQCLDTEPAKIKSSISQRDNIDMDDQVGILLDPMGSRQTSYEFYVNPNGIQSDAVNSAVNTGTADKSPDFVWQSAGQLTDRGYRVEIRIPLKSLRYQGDREVRMGVLFTRQVIHHGSKASWPAIDAGQPPFNFMATLVYKGLLQERRLELLPNFTYGWDSNRVTPDTWENSDDTNLGIGIKYGLTSSITAEATLNPDFSQVESDAFQMEINQRYPLFFSEKRPFFMESKEILDFSVAKWGLMGTPIHTRHIVDPGWAVKFSGSAGKMDFALLGANDRSPGYAWQNSPNPNLGKSALFGVFRAKYNIGSDNSLGVLYSGRYFAGGSNNVYGADLKYRLSKKIISSFYYLHSISQDDEDAPAKGGDSVNAMIRYDSNRFFAMGVYEHYSRDFHMATAYLRRSQLNRTLIGLGPIFNLKIKGMSWLKQIVPYYYYIKIHDLVTEMDDQTHLLGITFHIAPMGTFVLEYNREDEAWAGIDFHKNFLYGSGIIQIFKWLQLYGSFRSGDAIYYSDTPYLGTSHNWALGAIVQPGMKLNVNLDIYHSVFHRQDGEIEYTGDLYNLATTYQFNKYFFVRGILRYDSFQEKLLTDLLASFTFIPGTVVHLGYGSLHQRSEWQGDYWIPGRGEFMPMRRGLFFKASYLWRLD